jgi:hypothetical protein
VAHGALELVVVAVALQRARDFVGQGLGRELGRYMGDIGEI